MVEFFLCCTPPAAPHPELLARKYQAQVVRRALDTHRHSSPELSHKAAGPTLRYLTLEAVAHLDREAVGMLASGRLLPWQQHPQDDTRVRWQQLGVLHAHDMGVGRMCRVLGPGFCAGVGENRTGACTGCWQVRVAAYAFDDRVKVLSALSRCGRTVLAKETNSPAAQRCAQRHAALPGVFSTPCCCQWHCCCCRRCCSAPAPAAAALV